jgi:anaerobic selenocysteine-containing dehydrogenase
MHNIKILIKGKDRCTLQMHPEDATRIGIQSGQVVRVISRVGELEVAAEVTDSLMPGVVSLPHGWGHSGDETQMAVAESRAGVNSNILTDGSLLDPLSGNAVLNGIPVEVSLVS